MPDELVMIEHSAAALANLQLVGRNPSERSGQSTLHRIQAFTKAVWKIDWFQAQRTLIMGEIARSTFPMQLYISLPYAYAIAARVGRPDDTVTIQILAHGTAYPIPSARRDSRLVTTLLPLVELLCKEAGEPELGFRERFWATILLIWPGDSPEALLPFLPPISPGSIERTTGQLVIDAVGTEAEDHFLRVWAHGARTLSTEATWDGHLDFGPKPEHPELQQRASCEAAIIEAAADIARFYPGKKPSQERVADHLGITPRRLQQLLSRKGHNLTWRQLQQKGEMAAHR
jgi:hypothetical protein